MWGNSDKIGWEKFGHPAFGLLLTFLLMVLVWDIFIPFGRLLGRLLTVHPEPIWAYSVNVAGIWLFVALSARYLPPIVWFVVFAALALYFVAVHKREKIFD